MKFFSNILSSSSSSRPRNLLYLITRYNHSHHVCVIGSGPAGFYAAQHLLKLRSTSQHKLHLDIFEKLPVPFGLVRYGVAPDHPEVKNVTNTFNNVLKHEGVRFVGNIEAGVDVSFKELMECYHAIVLCYGATSDRYLNIENEHLMTSAREFVGWYNGLPANANLDVNLKSCKRAVIIGHGNVGLDIARILLTPTHVLENTDIAGYALHELKCSGVEEVFIVGRRGVLHVSFTIKEFREMVKLPGVGLRVEDFDHVGQLLDDLPRPRRRLTDLILKSASTPNTQTKCWVLKFLRSPVSVEKKDGRLLIRFMVNRMEGDKAVETGEFEDIVCDIGFRSIGYKGKRIFKDLPFDEKSGVIPNDNGRVCGVDGVYCSGWAGQGPRGVILSTMQNAFDVAKLVSSDLDNLPSLDIKKMGFEGLNELLSTRRTTDYSDYLRIAEFEAKVGRKITSVDEMMRVCSSSGNL